MKVRENISHLVPDSYQKLSKPKSIDPTEYADTMFGV